MHMSVIHADASQLDAVSELFDGYRQSYGQPSDRDGSRAFIAERLAARDSVILLAMCGSEGVGFVQLYPGFSSVAMKRIWILNDLFVAERARRQGVASRLLESATAFARESGALRMVLATAVDNDAAQALYEARGWQLDTKFHHFNLILPGG